MKITLVRDDGKVKTLRTLKMELLLEQMKTEVKTQPVSKMREVLRYTLPGNSIEEVRKVPKVMPAAAFVRKEGVMTLNEYNGIVMMEVNNLSGRAEADEIKELVKELPQTYLAFTGSSGKSVKGMGTVHLFGRPLADFTRASGTFSRACLSDGCEILSATTAF